MMEAILPLQRFATRAFTLSFFFIIVSVRRLNRQGVVNESFIRLRNSEQQRTRVMRSRSRGRRRSFDRGTYRPGIEPRNICPAAQAAGTPGCRRRGGLRKA